MLQACVVAFPAASAAAGGGATFTPLGDLPGGEFLSHAFDVSDDGAVVVGWSKANNQLSGKFRAFRWTVATGMVPLGHLGSPNVNGLARAVSGDGLVIVGDTGASFRWTEATGMVEIGDGQCSPLGLSADGSIVVGVCHAAGDNEAATWTASGGWVAHGSAGQGIIDAFFSDVSASGTVACGQSMIVQPDVEPIRWTQREGFTALGDVPGGFHYALGWAISADGSTIVGDAIGDVGPDAFRWTAEQGLENLELAADGVSESTAQDVSGDGSILVGYADGGINAMLWDPAHGMRSLQQVLLEEHGLDLPGWTMLGASAVSSDGRTVVGHATNPDGAIEAWRVELPAPSAPGDVNGDGAVGIGDLLDLLAAWGPCAAPCPPQSSCAADFDGDCTVGVTDLLTLLANWT